MDFLTETKTKAHEIVKKLQELIQSINDQKKASKIISEIKKLQSDLEKAYKNLGSHLEKIHFDKQNYQNAINEIKRACMQPAENNIQNALNKISSFIDKLAA